MSALRKTIKYITGKTIQPFVTKYLSKPRKYKYNGITLEIPPEVFHPGFFFSTKLLLQCILNLDLHDNTFLELGAGSGLIAFNAARKGAIVTASDINSIAIEYLEKNKKQNNIQIDIIHSDLYECLPQKAFDIIAINPPYYKKDPETEAQHAWYCGSNGSYFIRLFNGLTPYTHHNSTVLIILSEDCDLKMIKTMATEASFSLNLVKQKRVLWETLYIFEIKKLN